MIDKAQSPEESGRTETEQVQAYIGERLGMVLLTMTVTGEINAYTEETLASGTAMYAARLAERWMTARRAVIACGAA